MTWIFGPPDDRQRFQLIDAKVLTEHGKRVKVGNTALRILSILIDRAGRDSNRTPISPNDVARIWEREQNLHIDQENFLKTYVAQLRKVLGDHYPFTALRNDRNVGYWLDAAWPVQVVIDASAQLQTALTIEATRSDSSPPTASGSVPVFRAAVSSLPSSHSVRFLGRDNELAYLDRCWSGGRTRVVSFIGFGGSGKTALVKKWLADISTRAYEGAASAFAFSFYDRSITHGHTPNLFFETALDWFGLQEAKREHPSKQVMLLVEAFRSARHILVLDGIEVAQFSPGIEEGRFRDPNLRSLLVELAAQNPGLCILTSRLRPNDLTDFLGTSVEMCDLSPLAPEAGAELLRSMGIFGEDQDLLSAATECGGHAFTITLLASYLSDAFGGDVRERLRIGLLQKDLREGERARRIMQAYQSHLTDSARSVLRIVGLFDRPVGSIDFRAAAGADFSLSDGQEIQRSISRLRSARLLAQNEGAAWPIDAHRLVREYYAEEFEAGMPDRWKAAHGRVYEHLRDSARADAMSVGEMDILYAAVRHGCLAGRHKEALNDVYYLRISKDSGPAKDSSISLYQRGLISADLVALMQFFDGAWQIASDAISEDQRFLLLGRISMCYRALGYLDLSIEPTQLAFDGRMQQVRRRDVQPEQIREAASTACNLSRLRLNRGELKSAIESSAISVKLAERVGDLWLRARYQRSFADCLAQAGRLSEADALFDEAENSKPSKKAYGWGFHHCDFRIRMHEYDRALALATEMYQEASTETHLMDEALFNIAIGKVLGLARRDYKQAAERLDTGVAQIRAASRYDYVPPALLARAHVQIAAQSYELAEADVNEASTLARRSGMRLYEIDALLVRARLFLALRQLDRVSSTLGEARDKIALIGYRGALAELAEVEELSRCNP